MASRRRSLGVRIWRSGILQALSTDLAILVGVALIGVGIAHVSTAALWIYAGVVLIAGAVLVGLSADRERTRAPRKGEP